MAEVLQFPKRQRSVKKTPRSDGFANAGANPNVRAALQALTDNDEHLARVTKLNLMECSSASPSWMITAPTGYGLGVAILRTSWTSAASISWSRKRKEIQVGHSAGSLDSPAPQKKQSLPNLSINFHSRSGKT